MNRHIAYVIYSSSIKNSGRYVYLRKKHRYGTAHHIAGAHLFMERQEALDHAVAYSLQSRRPAFIFSVSPVQDEPNGQDNINPNRKDHKGNQ